MTKVSSKYVKLRADLLSEGLKEEDIEKLKPISDNFEKVKKVNYGTETVFIQCVSLSIEKKYELIDKLDESYFNTAIDKEVFVPEYVTVVSHILSSCIPVKLEHLAIEEIFDEIVNILAK